MPAFAVGSKTKGSSIRRSSQVAITIAALIATVAMIGGLLTFQNQLSKLNQALAKIEATASQVLGFKGSKKYLVAFQNLAEARGTGGILGAYAVVEFKNGHLQVLRSGHDGDLISMSKLPIKMPSEYVDLYGQDPAIWQNSNLSPNFADGAKIWLALWQAQFHEKLDGVIAVDSVTISAVLEATGPILMQDGETITSKNVVEKTLSYAYEKFENDNLARKEYLVRLMNSAFARFNDLTLEKQMALAVRFLQPEQLGRLQFYSADAATERSIAATPFGASLASNAKNEYRAVIVNTDGSKLDYYTRVSVRLQPVACDVGSFTEVRVRVSNTFDGKRKLPDYVWGRLDVGKPEGLGGAHNLKLLIFGPSYSNVDSIQRQRFDLGGGNITSVANRSVAAFSLDLKPLQSETLSVTFSGGDGELSFVKQPMVISQRISLSPGCG